MSDSDARKESPAAHSIAPSESRTRRRKELDGADRILFGAVLTAIVLVLSLMGWVVYSVLVPVPAPRTEAERQVMKLEGLSKTQPTNANVWADWARALVAAGEYSKASDVIERGSKEASQSAPIILVKAQMLAQQGSTSEALAVVTEVIADLEKLEAAEIKRMAAGGTNMTESGVYTPLIADAQVLRGELLAKTGKTPEAVKAYTAALERRPDMADVRVARGDLYVKLGRRGEAEADYRQALTMIPGYQPAVDGLEKLGEAATK